MTGPVADTPQRRKEDAGLLGRARAWWSRWGQIITGVWLFAISLIVVVIALQVRGQQAASDRRDAATAAAAKISCQRSRELGPPLADFLEREHAFPATVIARYRSTIPRSCPK